MHSCPKCGYEPVPEATAPPEVLPSWGRKGKWTVRMWTNESTHRWVKDDFDSEDAAREFANQAVITKGEWED
jgi:hypothetical protein